jgi:hypothetical protein
MNDGTWLSWWECRESLNKWFEDVPGRWGSTCETEMRRKGLARRGGVYMCIFIGTNEEVQALESIEMQTAVNKK